MIVWVLEDYNYEGNYWQAIFKNKPTFEQIKLEYDHLSDIIIKQILEIGYYSKDEYCGYSLSEYILK